MKNHSNEHLSDDADGTSSIDDIALREPLSEKLLEHSVELQKSNSIDMIHLNVRQEAEPQQMCIQIESDEDQKPHQIKIEPSPNQFISPTDMEHKQKSNFNSSEIVCLDTDEEDSDSGAGEVIIELNSDDDDVNDNNATHQQTMGVLMMAKSKN